VDEATAWLEQAREDRKAGEHILRADSMARCHLVAKYQQCAEKAVKGLVVALRDAGIIHTDRGRDHRVARFVKVLLRLPHAADNRTPQQHLRGLLNQRVRGGLDAIDAVTPRWPPPGHSPRRNTEYPFRDDKGDWTFPANSDVFTSEEIDRFRELTYVLLAGVGRVISAIRRRSKP
jgi:hypothetical protein